MVKFIDIAKDITGISSVERKALLRGREQGKQSQLEEMAQKVFGGEANLLRTNISGTLAAYHEFKANKPDRKRDGVVTDIEMQYALVMDFLHGFKKLGITLVGYDEEEGLQTVRFDPAIHSNLSPTIKKGDPAKVWKIGIALNGIVQPNLRPVVSPITAGE